ncbi:uncharacterized protein [Typha angustifolia]|uniref:uncharacterized protein isoform X2 n=1 Tax=Typha angustifolia TaxID=59011 RepID=UPI003C2E41C0
MGIFESLHSTTEAIRGRLPDPTPAKDVTVSAAKSVSAAAGKVGGVASDLGAICRISADYGWGAVSWVDRTVRVDGSRRIHEAMPDRRSRHRRGHQALHRCGIPAYRYLREEWSKGGEVRTPPAKDKAVEEELQALRKRVEIMEALAREGGGGAADKASEKPEDVIREFMAKGLNMGGFGKKNEQIFKVKSSLSPSQHNNSI